MENYEDMTDDQLIHRAEHRTISEPASYELARRLFTANQRVLHLKREMAAIARIADVGNSST